MRFESCEEAQRWAKDQNKTILFYEGAVIEATEFAGMHPGGDQLINHYANQDISTIFHHPQHHQHDYLSIQLLYSLQIGRVDSRPFKRAGYLNAEEPLMSQVQRLDTSEYLSVLKRPHFFQGSVRLFEMDFFEMFSLTDWKEIAFIYTLTLGLWFHSIIAYPELDTHHLCIYLASCVVVWLLTQYLLHHFIFHSEKYLLNQFSWFRMFHFCLHGIHHVLPLDRKRILFPPIMGVPITLLIWLGLSFTLPAPLPHLMVAGLTTGYVFYDMSHFAMHVVKKEKMKSKLRYHNRHHFAEQEGNYGVTTDILDRIFGTSLPALK